MIKYNAEVVDKIRGLKDIYLDNKTLSEVVGIPRKAMDNVMYRHGITRNNSNKGKNCDINHDSFSKVTPYTDYWGGFLAADGCVMKKMVQVNLKPEDHSHLQKLYDFVGSKLPVGKNSVCSRLSFSSEQIVSDLGKNYNITERKSLTYKPLRINKNFIRGYFDGDGCLYRSATSGCRVSIVGTEATIKAIGDFLTIRHSYSTDRGLHFINFGEACSLAFMLWIYSGEGDLLERKMYKFCEIAKGLTKLQCENGIQRLGLSKSEKTLKSTHIINDWQDLANYACLLAGYLESKKSTKPPM